MGGSCTHLPTFCACLEACQWMSLKLSTLGMCRTWQNQLENTLLSGTAPPSDVPSPAYLWFNLALLKTTTCGTIHHFPSSPHTLSGFATTSHTGVNPPRGPRFSAFAIAQAMEQQANRIHVHVYRQILENISGSSSKTLDDNQKS